MADAIDETIKLVDEGAVAQACEAVEAWTTAGRFQDLMALATALEDHCPTKAERQKERLRFEAVLDHLEDQIAIAPDAQAIESLLTLWLRDRDRSVVVPRTRSMRACGFASRLGYGQTVDAFLSTLERVGESAEHQELLACWLYEVVLRGTSLAEEPRAKRFRDVLANQGHPLAAMPLELRRTEHEVPSYMPLYGDKGLGRAIDSLASGAMSIRSIPPPADGAAVRATRIEDPNIVDRLGAAVRPWGEGKSGKVEAKVFELSPPVHPTEVGSWLLRALALDSTTAAARLECSAIGPEGVFGPLFSASSNGGAYSSGVGGAYGRLAVWTSLGALVGAPPGATIETIDALAKKCTFLSFRAPGPWFHDVAWDLGVLVLREEGRTAAVLAATDAE
jgi:hypothetical protein